jgi:hypothetical protein
MGATACLCTTAQREELANTVLTTPPEARPGAGGRDSVLLPTAQREELANTVRTTRRSPLHRKPGRTGAGGRDGVLLHDGTA